MTRTRVRRALHAADGLAITTFSQYTGANLVPNGTFDTGAGWAIEDPAHWTIAGGVLSATAGATGAVYRGGLAMVTNDFYQVEFDAAVLAGMVTCGLGVAGSAGQSHGVSGSYQEIVRFTSATPIIVFGGSLDFVGTLDNASVKAIERNPIWTMPSADGTYTLTFALPETPRAGQRIEMRYRHQDNLNYWAAVVIRSADNTRWDLQINSVSAAVSTNRISVTDVGAVDAVRLVLNGSTHTAYTGAGGVFTQRGSPVNVAHLNGLTGITAICTSAITPIRLSAD